MRRRLFFIREIRRSGLDMRTHVAKNFNILFSETRHFLVPVVLRYNYQKKNDERKVSSESINLLSRPSEKPWFSLFELAIFEKLDFEVYLIKSVHRDLRFSIFLVFPKNGPLRRLLGICLFYDQLFLYISATLCAIFMTLAPKMWRPQWSEVG